MSELTFNSQNLSGFGVYISGEGTYNAPTRAMDEEIVPGRNGTLLIDGGRWENIIVTYPAFIAENFDVNMARLRNFLASVRGYARLTDSYHPNEFRLASFSDGITVKTSGRYNVQGQFNLSFNCKPQRFLKSGEETTTFDASDLPTESFSGNPATFETDGEYKVSELAVNIAPVQSGTGDPSPTNVRPISGWTEVNVTRAGKNLLNAANWVRGTTFEDNGDGTYTFRKVSQSGSGRVTPNAPLYAVAGQTVTFSAEYTSSVISENSVIQLGFLDSSSVATEYGYCTVENGKITCIVPITKNAAYTRLYWANSSYGVGTDEITLRNIQIEYSDTTTAYEPYNSTTFPVALPSSAGTVYGGVLDVVKGTLTVDRAMYEFAADKMVLSGPLTGYSSTYTYRNATLGGLIVPNSSSDITASICNMLPSISRSQAAGAGVIGIFQYHSGSANELRLSFPRDDAYNTPEKIHALGVNCVIPFKTPTTYTLTPTEIRTLLGNNVVYADAGAVDGKYLLPLQMVNPTSFEAKPLIRIYGTGTVGVGDVNVTFDGSSPYVDLDCEIQDAFYGPTNKNGAVTLVPNRFPMLGVGATGFILGTGITKVEVTPRWYRV